jgi:hypothetical protein
VIEGVRDTGTGLKMWTVLFDRVAYRHILKQNPA